MTAVILAGTAAGIHLVEEDRTIDVGGPVTGLTSSGRLLAVVGARDVLASEDGVAWARFGSVSDLEVRCVLALGDEVLAGTAEAGLYSITGSDSRRVDGFDSVEGREDWYTPWGGPPDTRSLAAADEGAIYANVHVGGIPRSDDEGRTWTPTIDVDADVHQVLAHDQLLFAACAPGLAVSADRGETWRIDADGLDGHYCRAVAADPERVFVSASTGPFTKQAAIYRRPLGSSGPFEKCADGLPEWFPSNVDSHCLAADADRVAIGTGEGEVWISENRGASWDLAAKGLPGVTCLAATGQG